MHLEEDPDLRWTADLSGRSDRASRRALAEAGAERRLFSEVSREHAKEGRESYIEIDAPLELYALVRLLRPRQVIEVGVSSGVSSAYLLQALSRNGSGTLHSIDRPAKPRATRSGRPSRFSWSLPPGRSSGWAIPSRLKRRWDLRLGDKAVLLPPLISELDDVDLVLYDVPHDCDVVWAEFQRLDPLLPQGGVAIIDHGPGGGVCPALEKWARRRSAVARGRTGLGLYGLRAGPRTSSRTAPDLAIRPRRGLAALPRSA